MSKRRRTSSIASRDQDDFEDSMEAPANVSSGPGRKRKKLDPGELCQQIYDIIRNHKKDDGSLLCDAFIRVPKRRQEPSYYEVVSNPIDLLKVQQKLKTDEYEDLDELTSDIELLVSNAKAFYKRSSQEYKDACEFWELFNSTKNKILDIDDNESKGKIILKVGKLARRAAAAEAKRQDIDLAEDTSESSTNPDEDVNQFEDLFTAVMVATDSENRPLHTAFQLLPSKKKYPEYYEVIETPIDLKIIATKIQNGDYASLAHLEKDMLLMTKNACLFNEPGSQIYKDAKALKKVISSKKIEVEHGKYVAGKSSERIRNKRLRGVQSLSAITAALKDEETDTDADADETMDPEEEVEDCENPQWQLFDTVKTVTNGNLQISEPFWKLPSKRYYPDYYKEIKNPISLSQIKKKIKNGNYGTVSEVAGDMNIMFENAKKYNIPSSKLYKAAVKLQKVMQAKVQELLDIDQVTHKNTNRAHRVKDTDSDADSEDSRRRGPKGRPPGRPPGTPGRPGRPPKEVIPLKKKLHMICKTLIEYTCEDGRQPMLVFMEKPSKKLYPDYYQVIQEPIDLLTIEAKIKNEQYSSEDELVADFKLMFANCRQYNEEHSTIFEDANLLEKVLLDKVREMTPVKHNIYRIVKPKRVLTIQEQRCRELYNAIRDYREPKNNRQLALIFMVLPSKKDYPDYYEVIKNPIDMEKISQKLKSFQYNTLEEIVSDFILMFDNACKYNEPDSQIYKDALILQRVCLQTKLQLCEDEESVPDVQAAVQDMLSSLFTSVYNHQDDEGRCYSDSMAELPEHDEIDNKKVRALSLDLIKRRLDRGMYRRLDSFQEDFFNCLERARRLSRTDSQVFEDSVELQTYFIQQRDEICRNGDFFSSPALSYTLMHLTAAVQATKQNKLMQENLEDENETTSRNSDDSNLKESNPNPGESMTCNQQTFRVGEFVYLEQKEKGVEPSILRIERLWTNNGQQMLYGKFFVRPSETYHVATRKFLEKEVFMCDTHIAVPLDEVKERCCVMNIKDYMKMTPQGYADKDVYVCESRYSTKSRSFKKILKVWQPDPELVFVPREQPLELKRVMSVFRERVEKHKDELAELEEQEKIIEKEKPNIVVFSSNLDTGMDEGNTYYEQYNTICSGVVKTGDCVYVATDGGRQLIAQIDTIWDTKDGKAYFRGPWLVTPPEIPHSPNRLFYKQEVFLSTLEDANPLVGIVGKCAVLDYNDYISSRPTEIPEVDVYICESMYDEVSRQIRKLGPDGLKKYAHSNAVTEDEIYYFRRLINPPKVGSDIAQLQPEIIKPQSAPLIEVEASPLLTKITGDVDMLLEDSLDGGPPSVGSGDIPAPNGNIPSSSTSTPVSSKKKSNKRNVVTGYILYSSEVRKQVAQNNPESTFGEISRIVGNEWRSLPAGEKQAWEERAQKCNEENAAKILIEGEQCPSPAPPMLQLAPLPDQIYECLWDNCDYQFEEITDCIDHCIQEGAGHVQMHFQNIPAAEADYQCQWKGCGRMKKNLPPFPTLHRLARHVREVHINKGNGKIVPPADRSKNFVASSRHQYTATVKPTVGTTAIVTSSPAVQVKPQEPLFIAVPPRPQRVLHSEAYIKYIEGLQADNKFITPWEKTLTATVENTPQQDNERLAGPISWLANGAGNHGSVLNALWSLRDYMLRDSLNLYKNL